MSTDKDEPFPVYRVQTVGTGSVPLFAYHPTLFIDRLRKFNPDIVDVHEEPYSTSAFELVSLVKMLSAEKKIVIYSAQNILKKYPPPFAWSERYVMGAVDAAYPCSTGVLDVLRAKGFTKPAPIIPLGVDVENFSPTNTDKSNGSNVFSVGFAGRIEESKGLRYLLEAIALLASDGTADIRLKICGAGIDQQRLKRLAKELKIEDKTLWVGELSAADMPQFYRSCDVVVVPSITTERWKEQFGRSAAEAMSCGVPIIVSNSGSLPEVAGNAGIVVPERNSLAICTAIKSLRGDAGKRADLSKKARDRALQSFGWKTVADQLSDLYHEVLQA